MSIAARLIPALDWLNEAKGWRGAILMVLCWGIAVAFPASTASLIVAACTMGTALLLLPVCARIADDFYGDDDWKKVAKQMGDLLFPILSFGALLHGVGALVLGVNK